MVFMLWVVIIDTSCALFSINWSFTSRSFLYEFFFTEVRINYVQPFDWSINILESFNCSYRTEDECTLVLNIHIWILYYLIML